MTESDESCNTKTTVEQHQHISTLNQQHTAPTGMQLRQLPH